MISGSSVLEWTPFVAVILTSGRRGARKSIDAKPAAGLLVLPRAGEEHRHLATFAIQLVGERSSMSDGV